MASHGPTVSVASGSRLSRWKFVGLVSLPAFGLSEIFSHWLAIRFAMKPLAQMYQYLDPALLREDLLASLWHLHAQPPAFNAFLGIGLKLFPSKHALFFELVYGALAVGLLAGIAAVMDRMAIPRALVGGSVFAFALTPGFMVYRDWLFYTLPVAFLLIGTLSCVELGGRRGRLSALALASLGTLLMMTRAVFHPVWWVLVWGVLRMAPDPSRKRLRWVLLVPLLAMTCLFVKNLYLVDSLGASSWIGMNLAKRWPLSQSEMRELKARGAIPQFWGRRPFMEPPEFRPFGFFDPNSGKDLHPALGSAAKRSGEPNFNHRDYAAISSQMLEGDLYLIRHYPSRYLRRVVTSVLLFLQPGPNSVDFLVEYPSERVHSVRRALNRLWMARDIERPIRMLTPSVNLFLPLFALLVAWGIYQSIVAKGSERVTFRVMTLTILWVFAVTNFIEIGENDRMRWEVEPYLWVFATHGGWRLAHRAIELTRRRG